MHILHVTPYYAPAYAFGGVPRAVEGMARAQVTRGHTVTVLTTDALTQGERAGQLHETLNGVHVVRVRNASVWLRGKANLSTPVNMRAVAPPLVKLADVVHCHEFRTIENLLITPIANKLGVPLVLSPHGTLPHGTGRSTLKQVWDRALSPQVARHFSAVIGLVEQETDDAQALWRKLWAQAQFFTVPNGINPAEFDNLPDGAAFRQQYALGNNKIVLFMGRLHPRKGAAVLARAITQIQDADVRLVIVGPDEGLGATLAAIAQSDERIVLTGYLGGEQRLSAYAVADVFALPAVGEGLPVSALEAMAAGVPVLLSPGCNLPEVADAGAGVIARVDEVGLAAALTGLLQDKHQRAQMAAAARQLVRQRFTWASIAAQLEAVYAQVKS